MTTLTKKINMLPEARRRKIEALAEELRAEVRNGLMVTDRESSAVSKDPLPPTRTEQQETLLREVLARPGIPEMIQVYGDWQATDRTQESYRKALRDRPLTIATDHANMDPSRF